MNSTLASCEEHFKWSVIQLEKGVVKLSPLPPEQFGQDLAMNSLLVDIALKPHGFSET